MCLPVLLCVLSVIRGVSQGSVLGPLLFNVFLNHLFYFIKVAKLSNYADDNQLYTSDLNPAVVEETINQELKIASMWFSNNNLILNPDKCKSMMISNKIQIDDLTFAINGKPIPRVDSLELLGIVVEKSLYFSNHISKIAKKVGKQLDVLSRFKKILSRSTKLCLYKSFIIPHFSYCSSVWQNCLKADSNKLEKLNERALRYIYKDFGTDYQILAGSNGGTLEDRRKIEILNIVFKALNNLLPSYITNMFESRENIKNLRGTNMLVLPRVNTTRYGLKSTVYVACKEWNALPDDIRNIVQLKDFKRAVRNFIIT